MELSLRSPRSVIFAFFSIWIIGVALIKVASPAPDFSTTFPDECPYNSQNCSGFGIWNHRTEQTGPLVFSGSIEEAMDSVKEWASDLNRASIIHSNLTSIHIVDVTPFLRFEDDVFIHIECMEENTLIHARSSSRVGVSDLGVNPDRLDSLISHLKLGGSSSHGC